MWTRIGPPPHDAMIMTRWLTVYSLDCAQDIQYVTDALQKHTSQDTWCFLTSPVVFFNWVFWWSREEMELLLSGDGRLDTHTTNNFSIGACTHTVYRVCHRCYLTEQLSMPLARLVFSSSRVSEIKQQTQSVLIFSCNLILNTQEKTTNKKLLSFLLEVSFLLVCPQRLVNKMRDLCLVFHHSHKSF